MPILVVPERQRKYGVCLRTQSRHPLRRRSVFTDDSTRTSRFDPKDSGNLVWPNGQCQQNLPTKSHNRLSRPQEGVSQGEIIECVEKSDHAWRSPKQAIEGPHEP